jgi:predicted DNA-binding protein (MmcQ/YjbR family)
MAFRLAPSGQPVEMADYTIVAAQLWYNSRETEAVMTNERIRSLCLEKQGAYEDLPFGPKPICFKVSGRIFAELYPNEENRRVTLTCDAAYAHALRLQFPDVVVPGYHCPERLKPYKNTICLDAFLDDEALKHLIAHAYETVIKKLPRMAREALREGSHEA